MSRTAFPLYSPTGHWSVAAFVRKPQIGLFTPSPHHSSTPALHANRAQSCLIVLFRASTRWNPSLPPGQKAPFRRSSYVKARQTQSKCFPIFISAASLPRPTPHIVRSLTQSTTNGGCPPQRTLLWAVNPQSPIRHVLRSFSEGGNPPSFAEPSTFAGPMVDGTEGRQSASSPFNS